MSKICSCRGCDAGHKGRPCTGCCTALVNPPLPSCDTAYHSAMAHLEPDSIPKSKLDEQLVLQIITPRNDGCFVRITPVGIVMNQVTLFSKTGEVVDAGDVSSEELYTWIKGRQDY